MIVCFNDEQADARVVFHIRGVFAQLADVDIESRKILGKCIRDHREIWFAIVQRAQRGDPRGANKMGESLFRLRVHGAIIN